MEGNIKDILTEEEQKYLDEHGWLIRENGETYMTKSFAEYYIQDAIKNLTKSFELFEEALQ